MTVSAKGRVEHQKLNQVAARVLGFQLDCRCRKESDPRNAGADVRKKVNLVTWEARKLTNQATS